MLSALGEVKPAWEKGQPQSARGTKAAAEPSREELRLASKPYHVGRARARGQLRLALDTQDEAAQLRRLEQALNSPVAQYDGSVRGEISRASSHAAALSQRLQAAAKPREAWDVDPFLPAGSAGAQKIASAPKGGQPQRQPGHGTSSAGGEEAAQSGAAAPGSAEAEAMLDPNDPEGAAAAVRIQSMYRGRKDREQVAVLRESRASQDAGQGHDLAQEEIDGIVEDEATEAAAVKIQAVFRGNAARRSMETGEEEAAQGGEGEAY